MRLVAALCVAVLLAVPFASAQSTQNYDERYMVVGRVLDSAGLPANRLSVRVELVETPAPVASQALPTNCEGDFVVVFPVRELGAGQARVTIGANSTMHALDPVTRRTHVKLEADGVFAAPDCQASREQFEDRHVVTGRLVEPNGRPIGRADVTVTVRFAIGGDQVRSAPTNAAGDFAILFQSGRFDQAAEPDSAVMVWDGRTWTVELDGRFGVTVADRVVDLGSFPLIAVLAGTMVLAAAGVLMWMWKGSERTERRKKRRR